MSVCLKDSLLQEKLICIWVLWYVRLEIWNIIVLVMSGYTHRTIKSKVCSQLINYLQLFLLSNTNQTNNVVFLPFLLRSIAASKRTSSSPFGKTGTTQRGLEERKRPTFKWVKMGYSVKHTILLNNCTINGYIQPSKKYIHEGDHLKHSSSISQVVVQDG